MWRSAKRSMFSNLQTPLKKSRLRACTVTYMYNLSEWLAYDDVFVVRRKLLVRFVVGGNGEIP